MEVSRKFVNNEQMSMVSERRVRVWQDMDVGVALAYCKHVSGSTAFTATTFVRHRDSAPSVLAATATPHPTTAVSSVPVAPSVLGSRTLC